MATLRPQLDTIRCNSRGLYVVRLVLRHNSSVSSITLRGIELKKDQWDDRKCAVVRTPQKDFYNKYISEMFFAYQQALFDAPKQGVRIVDMTAAELRQYLINVVTPPEENKCSFKSVFDTFVKSHTNKRTRAIYRATWNKIAAYDKNAESLTFEKMNKAWLGCFMAWMAETSPSVNARNIHLRNIRAVFNEAIDNEYTTCYPFRRFKIRPEQTAKRNLSPADLLSVFDAKVLPYQQRYIDAFKLSFLLVGINMADLLSLRHADIQNGRVVYRRMKTHRLYSIRIEPEAQEIMDKYRGERLLLSWAENSKDYRPFYMKINPALQTVIPGITTYYARHSWATIAASLDIPKETIAAALGHGGHTVTDIYIQFDQRKIDEANRRVMDYVLYGKNPDR